MQKNIKQTLEEAASILGVQPDGSSQLEAAVLLCHLLEKPRSHLYAWPEKMLDSAQYQAYLALLQRRLRGEPIAYITGRREFWSLELEVTPDTLIPRPDTELLVELALAHLAQENHCRIADLGTGSGAIALAIAGERPDCEIHATDRSSAALAVARKNGDKLGFNNVHFHLGSWFEALPGHDCFRLILSNPPYIPNGDPHLAQGDLSSEPREALAAGHDGLDDIREITTAAHNHLLPGGWLLLEHGFDQAAAVQALLLEAGLTEVLSHCDLAGHERITEGRLPHEIPSA
ncbi:MAG: peptide chain release factor N(5)-glutamine methyltransferase [endosymbiont of Seepiophila jonesi]|uniref:Release factor glutamine methyltransferase n=1 Tax=endosymbiont of Lamellibrachia luymesi TaxID=2200907 RepID=A0A370DAD0_9GAMM|nr:MAG: peptide chain release factor N(5)-glutamine methyltransferase [endosymbiont of Lamellibrachia luymesi]RDH92110.1 MAG: peptide chain release factor N(5)-glutamine methyltransferase [endosymbiont of Seepiophila jonesi]